MSFIRKNLKPVLLLCVLVAALGSCKKSDKVFEDPYSGAKTPLGIKLSTDPPSPNTGGVGTTVFFKGSGLVPFKDSLHFYFNNELAQIVSIDSTGIKVKVPATASTGVGSLTVGDQIFFGPVFRINGNVGIDPNFKATVGTNGSVNGVLPLPDGRLVLVGSFNDFEHKGAVKPLNRILMTSKDGDLDRTLNSGTAVDGYLNTIGAFPNGKMVIAGGFSSYDVHIGQIRGITSLNKNGSLDSIVVRTFLSLDTVPAFNGGVDGSISRVFSRGNTVTAVGSFSYYLQFVYGQPDYLRLRDSLVTDSVRVRNLVRFFSDGSLDSSFNYNFQTHQSNEGTNGPILGGYMQDDGKLIIVGRFSKYNGENVNNIVRLNDDGSIDRSFKVGNGSDNTIVSIKYNATTHHMVLSGNFTQFGGEPHSGLVMLNEDGTIVESFKPSVLSPGYAYFFAAQLDNGLVIVNGYFKEYAGVHRGNFMVLDDKGALAPGDNTTGDFDGQVSESLETKSAAGKTQVLLIGNFYKFDEQSMGNITRILFN